MKNTKRLLTLTFALSAVLLASSCTQETQNKVGRALQNWTGTHGVLDIYAGDKLVNRFIDMVNMEQYR